MFPGRLVVNGSAGQVIARGPAVRLDGGDPKSGCCILDQISSQSGTVRLVVLIRMSSAFCRTSIGWRAVSLSLLRRGQAAWRDKSGDEMPDWVADKQRRARRSAKAELEAEAKAAAEAKLKEQAAADEKQEVEGRRKGDRKAAPPQRQTPRPRRTSPIPRAGS